MNKLIVVAATGALFGALAPAQADELSKGEEVFKNACIACHGAGVAGAPKLGDKAAWSDRIAKGMDTLDDHALHGFKGNSGFMPPKGGRMDLSDEDVKAAVAYMVSQAK
ncbi:MAG: c-type cytochrome [Gammaproteobacteria bacterium]|nr:c-type cytochrome [Gammaproteobacteria bacterium]